MNPRLDKEFFNRDTVLVARELLGMCLVREEEDRRVSGLIIETEAYRGEEDLACHARAGRTPRTEIMYGPPGRAYVYFVYGMHWLLNFVTEGEGFPAAVLIRGLQPLEGKDLIADRRGGQPERVWTDGPAKICQALNITGEMNGLDLCHPGSALYLERGLAVDTPDILSGPRVGLNGVPEPWKSKAWRFVVQYQG
jgi:DNA-3-methyladenine glycosylase